MKDCRVDTSLAGKHPWNVPVPHRSDCLLPPTRSIGPCTVVQVVCVMGSKSLCVTVMYGVVQAVRAKMAIVSRVALFMAS
jgi:hypothetical protein